MELYLSARDGTSFYLYRQGSSVMCQAIGIQRVIGHGTYLQSVYGLLVATFVCLTESAPKEGL